MSRGRDEDTNEVEDFARSVNGNQNAEYVETNDTRPAGLVLTMPQRGMPGIGCDMCRRNDQAAVDLVEQPHVDMFERTSS